MSQTVSLDDLNSHWRIDVQQAWTGLEMTPTWSAQLLNSTLHGRWKPIGKRPSVHARHGSATAMTLPGMSQSDIARTSGFVDRDMPSPTERERASVEFEAIWQVIKSWDINVPDYYEGYCGANGSHVKLIIDGLRGERP